MSRLEAGKPYTIRFRSPDGPPGRVEFVDLIRGRIEQQDNVNDIVLLKSSDQSPRLPTYHFAHVVDDTLMRVTWYFEVKSGSLQCRCICNYSMHLVSNQYRMPISLR